LNSFKRIEIYNYEQENFWLPVIYDRELEDTITSTWVLTDKFGDQIQFLEDEGTEIAEYDFISIS